MSRGRNDETNFFDGDYFNPNCHVAGDSEIAFTNTKYICSICRFKSLFMKIPKFKFGLELERAITVLQSDSTLQRFYQS